jgi:hypothetical protein
VSQTTEDHSTPPWPRFALLGAVAVGVCLLVWSYARVFPYWRWVAVGWVLVGGGVLALLWTALRTPWERRRLGVSLVILLPLWFLLMLPAWLAGMTTCSGDNGTDCGLLSAGFGAACSLPFALGTALVLAPIAPRLVGGPWRLSGTTRWWTAGATVATWLGLVLVGLLVWG